MAAVHGTRAWRKLRDQVVREEPLCWLRLDGCTTYSQTADHLLTVRDYPHLALVRSNLRGACHNCNSKRNAKPLDQVARAQGQADALNWFD